MKKYLFLFLCCASVSWAGGEGNSIGNGGDALVCPDGVSFFDIYEGEQTRGFTPDLGAADIDPFEKVNLVIRRLPQLYSGLSQTLDQDLLDFKYSHSIGDYVLTNINDSENVVVKAGCHLEQAVVQTQSILPIDKKYFINRNIWEQMNNNSKAALILHELIYRHAIQAGQTDSRKTRALNSYFLAGKGFTMEMPCELMTVLQQTGLTSMQPEFAWGPYPKLDTQRSIYTPECAILNPVFIRGPASPISNLKTI